MPDPTAVLRRGEVLWRAVLDGVLVRLPGADEVVKLTGTGAALWDELAEPVAFEELCHRLAGAYGTSPERVRADLSPALDDLLDREVVRRG